MKNKKYAPKGRSAWSKKRRFDDYTINNIRRWYAEDNLSIANIADIFDTTSHHIGMIVTRKIYKDVN